MNSRPRHLAHATFTVGGDQVDPQFWTQYFARQPDIEVKKGEPFRTPSGRLSSRPGRTGVWGCCSERAVSDARLDPHISYLISHLELPRPDLKQVLQDKHASMRILCFWRNDYADRVPTIDPLLRDVIASCGGVIEIDEYPQRHTYRDRDGRTHDVWI